MKIAITLPTMRVACDKCRHGTEPLEATGGRVEVEIGCKCAIPEPVLLLGFRGRSDPLVIPLAEREAATV